MTQRDHQLENNTLICAAKGIVARCSCGWTSGPRFSSLTASLAFRDHCESIRREREK
jgi:hypothetical protein